jgi:aminoglycoside/choline kinase family phosphotransferase
MTDLRTRLDDFLKTRNLPREVVALTADASTREYFRVSWQGGSAIACVYPEPFKAAEQTYLDVTRLFEENGLPVAKIYDFDEALGVIVLEDLGDTLLRDVLLASSPEDRERLIDEAISLIARIQAATESAFQSGSVASRLKFDVEKLTWELDFFRTHYFETLKKTPLHPQIAQQLTAEFRELAEDLESRATVLCHRDFHAANIMVDERGALRIIDHQDARIGTTSYDLVSLLLDRIEDLPPLGWLGGKRSLLVKFREELGLPFLDATAFAYEFRLQTVQRCLKAAGTFSYQSANRGKTYFLPFIGPMFRISLRALDGLDRFPVLRNVLTREIDEV